MRYIGIRKVNRIVTMHNSNNRVNKYCFLCNVKDTQDSLRYVSYLLSFLMQIKLALHFGKEFLVFSFDTI